MLSLTYHQLRQWCFRCATREGRAQRLVVRRGHLLQIPSRSCCSRSGVTKVRDSTGRRGWPNCAVSSCCPQAYFAFSIRDVASLHRPGNAALLGVEVVGAPTLLRVSRHDRPRPSAGGRYFCVLCQAETLWHRQHPSARSSGSRCSSTVGQRLFLYAALLALTGAVVGQFGMRRPTAPTVTPAVEPEPGAGLTATRADPSPVADVCHPVATHTASVREKTSGRRAHPRRRHQPYVGRQVRVECRPTPERLQVQHERFHLVTDTW